MREKTPVAIYLSIFMLIASTIGGAFNVYNQLEFGLDPEFEKIIVLFIVALMVSIWFTLAVQILMRKLWSYILVLVILIGGLVFSVVSDKEYLFGANMDHMLMDLYVWLIVADTFVVLFLIYPSSVMWFFKRDA